MRIGDLDALKETIKNSFKHNFQGYDALLISEIDEFIDNAPTVEPKKEIVLNVVQICRKAVQKMTDYEMPKDYIKNKLDYKVINRGKCMLCGKELTEGLFFCKECEKKGKGEEE